MRIVPGGLHKTDYRDKYVFSLGCFGRIDVPCAETLYGPRTSTFCNPLRHNAMQNNLVRGPLEKVGTTNKLFS